MNKPFHVAVNTRLLLKDKQEGIGRFSHEVLRRLVQQHPDVKFSFLFDRPHDPSFIFGPNVEAHTLFPQARHPFLYYLYFQFSLTRKLRQLKPDVFFSPDGYLSLRTDIPQVPVFHDLAFEAFPKDAGRLEYAFYHRFFPRYARKARAILAVSEYTKQDIVNRYHIAPEKISVTCNGPSAVFRPLPESERQATRLQYSEGQPYFHFVGAIQPRKNLVNLIRAYDLFKTRTGSVAKLLIVGRKAWNFEEIIHSYTTSTHKADIIFTGYVSDEDLNRIYNASLALCYVPYFEGFGIPIVEAFQCGIPVITSNVTSMPEVAGDAALTADPLNPQDIANALCRIWQEPETVAALVQNGILRKGLYTWERAADAVWRVLTHP
jgi:glycosyltransferase involved in cell wall biosynthesis